MAGFDSKPETFRAVDGGDEVTVYAYDGAGRCIGPVLTLHTPDGDTRAAWALQECFPAIVDALRNPSSPHGDATRYGVALHGQAVRTFSIDTARDTATAFMVRTYGARWSALGYEVFPMAANGEASAVPTVRQ